jgi:hypothetical protein
VIHALKTWPKFFQASWIGLKPYEVRFNDRDFAVGDRLRLLEWDPETRDGYTGREIIASITSILAGKGFMVKKGYAVLGISILEHRMRS